MSNVRAGLSKLNELHPDYRTIAIRADETMSDEDDDDDEGMKLDSCHETEMMEVLERIENGQPEVQSAALPPAHVEQEVYNQQAPNVEDEKDALRPGVGLDSCLQPSDLGEETLTHGDGIFSIAPAQGNTPVRLEAMAFPVQFPTGQNTLDKARQFVTETHMAKSSMSIQLRKGKAKTRDGRKISNKLLQDKSEVERLVRNRDATRFMQPLRGTPAYWDKTLKDLLAMVRQLGKPTFFLTFSAAEFRWPEVITAIKAQQGQQVDFAELDWAEKCDILRSNPVTTMRMFDKRIDALMTQLLLGPAQPIGEVIDYFYRVEFQARGSPHIHCLCWVAGAPVFGEDPDDKVCDFVDHYVSCQLPDAEKQPLLHGFVTSLQTHSKNHSKSCKKDNRACRFGFPKPPARTTRITYPMPEDQDHRAMTPQAAKNKLRPVWNLLNNPTSQLDDMSQLLATCNMTLKEYNLSVESLTSSSVILMKRDVKDCWVNNYNPHLLTAWNANMDIQYILDEYGCIMYMLSYISKPESEMSDYLKTIVKEMSPENETEREEMKGVLQAYSKHREVSAQESVARTCSLKMKSCSREVVFLQTGDNPLKMSLRSARCRTNLQILRMFG
ncbi:hypothetical protein DPEC_G00363740 [Dallia pectoralis]|nr:hypothetical protein DPEC_G00363740 [Dallia pectoralis]